MNVWTIVLTGCALGVVCLLAAAGLAWLVSEFVFWWRARQIPPGPVVEFADGTKIYEWELSRLTEGHDL